MNQRNTATIAILSGLMSVVIGLVTFTLSWNLWEFFAGPMPGVQILLFPGNLTLVHLWHPLFTEELTFWPKLALQMVGQFAVVASVVAVLASTIKKWRST
ncbi:hypothetical protein [Rheinheimera sp. WS51]|uniref:hypothetical protein n=1 Tax=Rheinheimera sp. WS51 TaxID=3425886 RepID=UPI003D8EDF0D